MDTTTIPDITDPDAPIVEIPRVQDCQLQKGMILVHRYYLGMELGREPTELEAAQSWVARGFAKLYRQHVKVRDA
jgi:hypothetical protein